MADKQENNIVLEETCGRGRYSLRVSEGLEAELTFQRSGDGAMVVDHTFVPQSMRGQGVAAKLVERAVADARENGSKMVPLCSYVAAEFRRRPEWADLLKR